MCASCDNGIVCREREAEELTHHSARSITWRSQQLTKGRDQGDCANAGERMHLEALLDLRRREEKVPSSSEVQFGAALLALSGREGMCVAG